MGDVLGRNVMGMGRLGSGERAHGICAPFSALFPCPGKVRNGNCDILSEDVRES